MAVDFASLKQGETVSERTYALDSQKVVAYVDAVGDRSGVFDPGADAPVAPPMAVAAHGLRSVFDDLSIPAGALHAGQEFDFAGAVHVGETLRCRATVAQNTVRAGWRFLMVQLTMVDGQGREVLRGKSTIMLPVSGA